MEAFEKDPIHLLFWRPCREKQGSFLLWIALAYTHTGPDGESFASSVLCRAFQQGTPLAPGLVSGQPLFYANTAFRPLNTGEQVHIHLSYKLMDPTDSVDVEIRSFLPFSSPCWHLHFRLSPPWDPIALSGSSEYSHREQR